MRGLQNDFDSFSQVESRLKQLNTIGHSIQKVEMIVMGGDWCSKEPSYRESFVKGCFDAMNGVVGENLNESHKANETAEVRNVGLTFETRPDWVTPESVDEMLLLQGAEDGYQGIKDGLGWTLAIDENTGRAVMSASWRDAALVIFGACTPK